MSRLISISTFVPPGAHGYDVPADSGAKNAPRPALRPAPHFTSFNRSREDARRVRQGAAPRIFETPTILLKGDDVYEQLRKKVGL